METLKVDKHDDGVVVVRLARPPVNAVNKKMIAELTETFNGLSADKMTRAIVLSAEGEKAFCGGIDLAERKAEREGKGEPAAGIVTDPGLAWRNAQRSIRHCAVPVIVAVDGPAIGAGFGLVEASDIIIASEKARLGLTEINVGLLGGSSKARRMVGPYKARYMFFSGELIPAEEFYRRGVVEKLTAPGEAESTAIEMAEMFAAKSPIAMRMAKESVLRIESMPVEDAYRTEQDYTERLKGYNDSKEAMSAFLEKRKPEWTLS